LHEAGLIIFDSSSIHWMNSCMWTFWNTVKVEVEVEVKQILKFISLFNFLHTLYHGKEWENLR